MKRREFLRRSGWFVAAAALAGIPGCGDNAVVGGGPDGGPATGTYRFPQGIASGDPRETSVVLWTRVEATAGGTDPIDVLVEVASDAGFNTVVVHQTVSATSASDHAVRVLITGLAAATAYYYRFTAGSDRTGGRTRTAPGKAADVQVNLAWVSCQDYGAGTYGSYRQMIIDDDARDAADQIHAVVHLGDVIYETIGGGFQVPLDDNFTATTVTNRDGTPRVQAPFPSGGGSNGDGTYARTVDDYRHLYKQIFTDPDWQAARARWPFIHVWDDHEFTDDCWQSQANYDRKKTADEAAQTRRIAANQAWFEFLPVQLTGSGGVDGVPAEAKDFASATVTDAMFTAANDDNFVDEPNNAAAVGSITIYRSFRFGKHVELVMTDERAYRSDHAIPEETTFGQALFFNPRNVLPLEMVNVFDQGKTANGGNPPATVLSIPNPRTTAPVGTMLGKEQKAWWKATMKGSDATWKLWGNEVPLMRFFIKKDPVPLLFADRVMDADAWDGYPTERKELMTYLKDEGVKNVVVLTGDIHAHFAGVVMDDFDAASPTPVATELIAAGISSNSLYSFYESATRGQPAALRNLIACDASSAGGSKFTESINMLLTKGTAAANAFGNTKDLAQALALAEDVNPHLKYADSNAQGYGYVKITAAEVVGTLVTINRPVTQTGDAGPGIKRSAVFTVPKDDPGAMSGPVITGTKPFPLA